MPSPSTARPTSPAGARDYRGVLAPPESTTNVAVRRLGDVVRFEIDLFFPLATPGAEATLSRLGACKIITQPILLTVTDHAGKAEAVALADLREVDRTVGRYTTVLGRVSRPRSINLPERIYVETPTGHTMVLNGRLVARMVRTRRQGAPVSRVSW
jgi:hypothetical protein